MITVYVLQSIESEKRYVGITNNPRRRFKEHRQSGSTVQRQLGRFYVLYKEQFSDYQTAREREKFFKSGKGREWLDHRFRRSMVGKSNGE